MEVVEEDDNVVIKSASPEVIYVPQYDPQVLYVPDYPPAPVAYYPNPYPYYYSPTATFFAGAVTGAIWASVVDWNDWDVWGGSWDGGDIKIDCNKCFNNVDIDGKIDIKDVDWKNVDRDKISIDRNEFNKIDRTNIKNNIERDRNNSIGDKAANLKKERPSTLPANVGGSRDVRKSMQEGLKKRPATGAQNRPNVNRPSTADRPKAQRPANKGAGKKATASKKRPSNKKAGAKVDRRPKKPTSLGNVSKGKRQKVASKRGSKSMGGGSRKAGGHKSVKRKGGGKRRGGGGRRR